MKQRSVVVIEDDSAVNEAIVMILERSGFLVRSFLAVKAFEEGANEEADIYIIDRQLKGTDGLQVCRRLKAQETTSHIPVIIMSASPNAQNFAADAGADAFLNKPFSKKQLIAVVERLIQARADTM